MIRQEVLSQHNVEPTHFLEFLSLPVADQVESGKEAQSLAFISPPPHPHRREAAHGGDSGPQGLPGICHGGGGRHERTGQ